MRATIAALAGWWPRLKAVLRTGAGLLVRAQIEHRFAIEETFLVDDSPCALRAADVVGCPSVLIRRPAFLEPAGAREEFSLAACNLYEAAELILAARDTHQRERALLRQ